MTTVLGVISKPALVPWARNIALASVRGELMERVGRAEWITQEWVEGLINCATVRPEQARMEAADFGTQAHVLIEQFIQVRQPEVLPAFTPVMDSFQSWPLCAGLDIHHSGTKVFPA